MDLKVFYNVEKIADPNTKAGYHWRIYEVASNSRVATCYHAGNATLVIEALNVKANIEAQVEAAQADGSLDTDPQPVHDLADDEKVPVAEALGASIIETAIAIEEQVKETTPIEAKPGV